MTLYRCPKCGKAVLGLAPPTCCGVQSVVLATEAPEQPKRKSCCLGKKRRGW